MFEPDADAITDALQAMRNNEGNPVHSLDVLNDQENCEVRDEVSNVTDPNESCNQKQPSDLDPSQSSNQASGIVTYHNQPSEISDDELRESVRSLNAEQRYAYDTVLSLVLLL